MVGFLHSIADKNPCIRNRVSIMTAYDSLEDLQQQQKMGNVAISEEEKILTKRVYVLMLFTKSKLKKQNKQQHYPNSK